MPADLADRVRRLEDRAAISQLVIRYCVAMDDGDWAGLVEMYADKATFGDVVGKQEVVDTLRSIRESYGRCIHVPEAHSITFADDDHATGLVLSHAELDIQGRTVQTYIRYYDDYERRGDGEWVFSTRNLKFAYALPVEEMADALTGENTVRWPGTEPVAADRF